ncbi:hypothetical protein DFH27DRAFT_568965 [Peziza echinospora]|nr:hypothetical protein DFH27DRAFT_568965 [Peziza echinospora]
MFLSRKLAAQEAERVRLEEVVRVERERQGQVGASVKIEEVDFDDVVAGGEESGEGDSDEPTLPPVPTGGESASAGSGSGSPITAIYISETTGRIAMVETPAGISSSSSSSSSNKQSSKRNHQPQEQSLQKQKDKDKGKQQLRELTPEVPQKVVYYPVKCDDESRWEHIEPGWYEPISSSPLSAPVVITESSGGGSSSNVNNVHESTMVATMHMAVSQEDEGKGRDVRIVVEGGPVAGVAGVAGEEEKKSLSPRSRAREFARRSRAAKLWVNGGEWVRSRKEL